MTDDFREITIKGRNVKVPETCIVCNDFAFRTWRVVHGECECKCGAIYQIIPLSDQEWEDVPYHKISEEWIPACRAKYKETGTIENLDEWVKEKPEHAPDVE